MKTNKRFDKKSDDFGKPAERAVFDYLKGLQDVHTLCHFPFGKYGVDIFCHMSERPVYIDVERRSQYVDTLIDGIFPKFPYDTVSIPYRKKKMIKKWGDNFLYYVVSASLIRALVFPAWCILSSPTILKWCANSRQEEEFFDVPLVWGRELVIADPRAED